jgi:hypothetical protein
MTIPIGPVIQAFYAWQNTCTTLRRDSQQMHINCNSLGVGETLTTYDNTSCGKEFIDVWTKGMFCKSDIALQLSMDGAHLHPDQLSKAWVFIWIFHDLPPQLCYKKQFVISTSIVPGPNKPEDLNLFLFPSLSHIAVLQHKGLCI